MMKHRRCVVLFAMCCGLQSASVTQTPPATAAIGSLVAELSGDDASGKALEWGRWPKRAVVLFFHSPRMAYSRRGLNDVAKMLALDTDLLAQVALLVVVNDAGDAEMLANVTAAATATEVPHAVVIDADRTRFRSYHVVAYPTVFCIDPTHHVIDIAKGYGPGLAVRVTTAAKLAVGQIDRETFERTLAGKTDSGRDARSLKISRTVLLARQLVAGNRSPEARTALLKVLDMETSPADGAALLARIYLGERDPGPAEPWVQRVGHLAPNSREHRILRAMLEIQRHHPSAVEQQLEGLDHKDPEIAVLLGQVREGQGRYREAAALYRGALEALLARSR